MVFNRTESRSHGFREIAHFLRLWILVLALVRRIGHIVHIDIFFIKMLLANHLIVLLLNCFVLDVILWSLCNVIWLNFLCRLVAAPGSTLGRRALPIWAIHLVFPIKEPFEERTWFISFGSFCVLEIPAYYLILVSNVWSLNLQK